MSDQQGFLGFLLLTVALLVLVAWTGHKAKRKLHIILVVVTVLSLASSIRFALLTGRHYDLESAGIITPIHMFVARAATICYLLPVVTGVLTIRKPSYRKLHGKVALLVIAVTVLATITGAMMLWKANPIDFIG